MLLKQSWLCFSLLLLFSSCSQKVYFFDAHKQSEIVSNQIEEVNIFINSFFAGDALDYVIFELDVNNKSQEPIDLNYRNVYLEVYENEDRPIILDALHKDDVIRELEERHRILIREKRARDIGNAVDIGINLLFIGTSGGYGSLDAILYSTDVASYMLEDARSHKLMTGSLEEQIDYVDEWVLHKATLNSGESGTWDILFPRELFDTNATFVLKIGSLSFTQEYDLDIIEEKIRR